MTRSTNARLAGFMYLFYIAVGVTGMIVTRDASSGDGTVATLASMAAHAVPVRVDILLGLVMGFTALTLAVALYGITRDEDRDLARLALLCRVGEGLLGALSIMATLGLLRLGTAAGVSAPDGPAVNALAGYLLEVRGWNTTICAIFFAMGSTLFSYLLLRGRIVPVPLAWLGVIVSALLVGVLPLQLTGFLSQSFFWPLWLPMAVFEVTLALWLLFKGAALPVHARIDGER